jgi:hypothetical protein
MCGGSGTSVNSRQCGVESRHGSEKAALKNNAPFNRTPFKTSENASIVPPDDRPNCKALSKAF